MENKCPKCGKPLPEEAAFCLYCFTDINSVFENSQNAENKTPEKKKSRNKKAYIKAICGIAVFVTVFCLSTAFMRSANSDRPLVNSGETVIVKETEIVAVTKENGEAVTDEAGKQVLGVVEVSRIEQVSEPEKQGFFDRIFAVSQNKNTTAKESSSVPENTGATSENTAGFTAAESTGESSDKHEHFTGTTDGNTSESTASSTEASTKPTEIVADYSNMQTPISDFEYTLSEKYATVTAYNGNDKYVTVPAVIEGKYVTNLGKNLFYNNSAVEVVTIADDDRRPYLWVRSYVFNSCPNLRVINFPDTDLGIYNDFASNCPSIESLSLKNFSQFRYKDGALYYTDGKIWKLRYYCPAYDSTVLTLPSWATSIESNSNLKDACKLKEIRLHEAVSFFSIQDILPPNLENIVVSKDNPYGFDINGIAFNINSSGQYCCVYPPENKTKELALPENAFLNCARVSNPYLKVLHIPASATVYSSDRIANFLSFSSLETLYLEKGSGNEAALRKGMYDLIIY